jgi:hypothetical protein
VQLRLLALGASSERWKKRALHRAEACILLERKITRKDALPGRSK